eukprot:g7591.t1
MSDLGTDIDRAGIPYAKQQAIIQVAQACASLSFLGSAVIVVAYFRFKQLRTYSFQLVCWLAVCDIAVNLSFFVGSPNDGSGFLCYSQGLVQRFFQVALIQWTLLIAQSILVVSSKTRTFNGDKRMPWNHVWAWGVSALLSVAPLSTGSFGRTENFFCGVDGGDSWNVGSLWRVIFLVMVFTSMVAIVWAYAEVVNNLNRAQKNVFRLSQHATTNRYKEAASTKQQHQGPATAIISGEASSASLSTTSHLKTNRDPSPPVSSLDESTTSRGLFVGGQETSSESKRSSRRDSLWKRIILGTIMEGSEGSASLDCSWRQGVVERRQDIVERQQGVFESSCQSSRSSSISYTRSNSNISAKDWLWSTSPDMGFFDEVESLDESSGEEEECKNVLWLNGMASPAKRRLSSALTLRENSAPIASSPEHLPVSKEARQGSSRVGGGAVVVPEVLGKSDDALYESAASSMRTPTMKWKNLFPNAKSTAEFDETASTSAPESAPGPQLVVEHVTAASSPGLGGGDVSSPCSSLALGRICSHIGDPLVAPTTARSESSKSYVAGTAIATPQRPFKSRLVNQVDRARGYVHRMSSLDIDNGSGVVGRGGRYNPAADKGGNGRGRTPPGHSVSGATTPTGAREQDLSTKRAQEMDMDRFISRIKWYPVIYVLTWIIPLINGIYTIAVGQSNASFSFVLLATVSSRLQGLLNFICYGLNDKLKQAWLQDFMYRRAVASCCRALWCCCFGPCYRHEDGKDDDGGVDTKKTRQTDDVEQGSSVFTDADLADEIEKGEHVPIATLPPVLKERHRWFGQQEKKNSKIESNRPGGGGSGGREEATGSRRARPDKRPNGQTCCGIGTRRPRQ